MQRDGLLCISWADAGGFLLLSSVMVLNLEPGICYHACRSRGACDAGGK